MAPTSRMERSRQKRYRAQFDYLEPGPVPPPRWYLVALAVPVVAIRCVAAAPFAGTQAAISLIVKIQSDLTY